MGKIYLKTQEVIKKTNYSQPPKSYQNKLGIYTEGLKDINVSEDFIEIVENNESNTSAIELIKEDIDQQTEINTQKQKL